MLAIVASVMLSAVTVQATNYTDVDILNFALNLEVCRTTKIARSWLNKLLLLILLALCLACLFAKSPTRPDLQCELAVRCFKGPVRLLQCLEAEFYSWVAYGEGIYSVDSSLVGESTRSLALVQVEVMVF